MTKDEKKTFWHGLIKKLLVYFILPLLGGSAGGALTSCTFNAPTEQSVIQSTVVHATDTITNILPPVAY